jgi:hypothetical protein
LKKFKWFIILIVVLSAVVLFKTYSNQIVSIAIYKPDENNVVKHIVTIPRDKERKDFIKSVENSFSHQQHADPKSDAIIDNARYFRLEVKKRVGAVTVDLLVTQQKVGVQERNKTTKIEGKYAEAINELLKGL